MNSEFRNILTRVDDYSSIYKNASISSIKRSLVSYFVYSFDNIDCSVMSCSLLAFLSRALPIPYKLHMLQRKLLSVLIFYFSTGGKLDELVNMICNQKRKSVRYKEALDMYPLSSYIISYVALYGKEIQSHQPPFERPTVSNTTYHKNYLQPEYGLIYSQYVFSIQT